MLTRLICTVLSFIGISTGIFQINQSSEDVLRCWLSFGRNDGVYAEVKTSEKVIALTFDDGPHPKLTNRILDILDKYDAKATFFVIGKNAELYPQIIKRIADNGHEIGNHTYSHLAETNSNSEKLKTEILKTEDIIFKITGTKTSLFRPPTGYCSKSAVQMTKDLSYKTIVWNIDTKDWAHRNKTEIIKEIKNRADNGSIILFHDFIAYNSDTPEILSQILPFLKSKGYSFITVSEMLSLEEIL